jgi:hypothetical protein
MREYPKFGKPFKILEYKGNTYFLKNERTKSILDA